ncbi:hypothetical protein HI914_05361 [Erysiphe necator]|nr:hypothetical protein HI914_05361 [Erysiphe necator]
MDSGRGGQVSGCVGWTVEWQCLSLAFDEDSMMMTIAQTTSAESNRRSFGGVSRREKAARVGLPIDGTPGRGRNSDNGSRRPVEDVID